MSNDNLLETGEILKNDAADASLKQDLNSLAKAINVKESDFSSVDDLFNKLNSKDFVEAGEKNRALQYALKTAKITVGNAEMTISEIADIFDNAVEQDDGTWKIKLKEGVEDSDKDLVEGFLNQRGSSLAYLIQLSSQYAKLQASKGYGKNNADGLVDVRADKVFGNQTRMALSGLKDWVEGDYTKDVESFDVTNFTVDQVLGFKYISSALKEKIEKDAASPEVKNLWTNEEYELKNKYTNNFALKRKVTTVDNPKREEGKKYTESTVEDKKVKSYTISSVDELPSGYKWKDPENYDVKIKDTYPKVYQLSLNGVTYTFYSNGRCRSSLEGEIYNTKDIIERIRSESQEGYKTVKGGDGRRYKAKTIKKFDDLPKNYMWENPGNYKDGDPSTYSTVYHLIIGRISKENPYIFYGNGTCKSPLDGQIYDSNAIVKKLNGGRANEKEYGDDLHLLEPGVSKLLEGKEVSIDDTKYKILVKTEGNKLKFYLEGKEDYYKYLSVGDLLDKTGTFDDNYFEKVLLLQVKKDLESQCKADSVMEGLKDVKNNKGYSMADIFGNDKNGVIKYLKYFDDMDGEIKIKNISREGTNIKFSLGDKQLSVKYTELADNGKFSETKLKAYLNKEIIKIVEK